MFKESSILESVYQGSLDSIWEKGGDRCQPCRARLVLRAYSCQAIKDQLEAALYDVY